MVLGVTAGLAAEKTPIEIYNPGFKFPTERINLTFWEIYGERPGWGEWADKFYIPLTYSNYDPEDFGQDPSVEFDRLLKQFRPRVYVAPGGLEPIDFYEDYLPNCVLKDARQGGAIVNFHPTRDTLKRVERNHELYLDYSGPENLKGSPVAYGRIHQQRVGHLH